MQKSDKIANAFYDIFDTIVSRNVQPEYVKKIWSNNIVKIFNLNISAVELYSIRNNIETRLANNAVDKGYDCEYIYDDIITEIFNAIKPDCKCNEFIKTCEDEEIAIESRVLYVNNDIISEIKKQKKNGCRIYCVTDMYLSKNMIKKIFTNLKIEKLFDDIFVSGEYLYNKRSGKLYDVVLNKLKASPEKCIMTGDNKEKDYDIPKSKGMKAVFVNRNKEYEKYDAFIKNNTPEIALNNLVELSKKQKGTFNNAIFSLYNFIDKLYFKLKKENYNEVFFLAREGEYLKKLFDYYVENVYGDKIQSHYVYVSRKATYLPSLKSLKEEDFSLLLDQYSYITIREFLSSLNFSNSDIKLIENDIKDLFALDYKIGWFKDSIEFKVLKRSDVFAKIYEKNRIEQKTIFKKYISQLSNSKRLMLVDVGWNGSIQDNVQNILGSDYDISGCYFGLSLRDRRYSKNKYGLIFSNDPYENLQYPLYFENRTLYEILLGASHGSANKYVMNSSGKADAALFRKKEEQDIYKNVVKPIQDAMFKTFKMITSILCNKYYDNKKIEKAFNKIQYDMLYNPTKEQLDFFDRIYHYENFGVFEFTTFSNKNKIGLKRYIKEHAKFFIKYKTYFDDAFWPVLKLYNNKMYIPLILYKWRRKKRYKRNDLF